MFSSKVSSGSIIQPINGATVSYTTGGGRVIGQDKFIAEDKISKTEFLEFIENWLDWKLSKPKL